MDGGYGLFGDCDCLFDVFLQLLQSSFCGAAGHMFLLGKATATGDRHCHEGAAVFLTMFQRVACETVTSLCTFSGCFPYCINLTIAIQHKPQRTCNLCFNSKRIALRWFCTVGQRFLLLASIKFLL